MNSEPAALLELLNFCFPEKSKKPSKLDQKHCQKLLKTIDINKHGKLIPTIEQHLEPLDCLEQAVYAQLRYCDQLFSNYHQGHKLDLAIQKVMLPLLPIMADTQLENPKWAWLDHPFIELLELIQQNCIGWHNDDNRISNRFLEQLQSNISKTHEQWQQGTVDFSNTPLTSFFEQQQKRLHKLELRVKESESGALKAKRAQDLSTRIINEKMQSKLLPASIVQILQTSWHDSLILLLVNSNNLQAESHRLGKLTETLIWTFQPFETGDNDTQQRIYRIIGNLQEDLTNALASLKHQPDKMEQTLATIEAEHLKILKGETIEADDFALLEANDLSNTINTKISGTLLKKVNLIKEGQWFSLNNENQSRAIKLLLKLPESQQLLFGNHAGMKACQFSFEEFAYKLSNNSIKPLPDTCRIKQTSSILVENLIKIQHQQQEKIAAHLEVKQRELIAREEQRKRDREKALSEAKEIQDKNKALQKSQEEKQQKIKEAVKQPELSFTEQQKYSVLLHQLAVGGKIRFFRGGKARECKLAAITQQASKYIFVNKEGIKDCEILKQELIMQLATKQAEIIDNGDNFDDALSKVVSSIRNKT